MGSKFKPGDRVVGILSWEEWGTGTIIKQDDYMHNERYQVLFDMSKENIHTPWAKFLRKLTKLEEALE